MDLIGVNTDLKKSTTNSYKVEVLDKQLVINSETVDVNTNVNNNTLTLATHFIEKNTTFTKFVINIDTVSNTVLEKSYVIYGNIMQNSYVETQRELLIEPVYYNNLKNNFVKLFGNEILFHRFILNVPFSDLKSIIETNIESSCIYTEFTGQNSMYIDDLNTLHQSLMKSIFLKVFVLHKKEDAQIVIKYGTENNVEYLNNQLVLTVSDDFYQCGIDTIKNLDSIKDLLLEHDFKDIKLNLPKIEKPAGGCCGGGACGKTKEECSAENSVIEEPISECCKNKPDSECCKKNKDVVCNCGPDSSCKNNCKTKISTNISLPIENKDGFTLYMKGTKDEPKCKFSRATIEKLSSITLDYNTYNILDNPDLREHLKLTHPTFPQLWYKYNFVCGGDTIKDTENLTDYLEQLKL